MGEKLPVKTGFLQEECEKLDVSLEMGAWLEGYFGRLGNGIIVEGQGEEAGGRRGRVEEGREGREKRERRSCGREESPKCYPPIDMENVPKPCMVKSQIIDLDRYFGKTSPVKPKEILTQRARIERQPKNQFF